LALSLWYLVYYNKRKKLNKGKKEQNVMKKRKKIISARQMLIQIAMLFLVPFFLFLFGFNVYSNYIYREELTEKNLSKITMYQSFFEGELKRVEYYLADMVANDNAYNCMRYPLSNVDAFLHMNDLKEKLNSVISTIDFVDALCIMSLKNDMYDAAYSEDILYEEKEGLKNYLKALLKNRGDDAVSSWNIHVINGENYFIKIIGTGQVYSICVVNAANASRLDRIDSGDSYLIFADTYGFLSYQGEMEHMGVMVNNEEVSYLSGQEQNRLVVSNYSDYLGCNILLVDPYRGIWAADATPFMLMIATMVFAALMICCYHLMKKEFLSPLEKMVITMEEIAQGGANSRLKVMSKIIEYGRAEDTFNHMISRISELKILAYDRLIQVQQTQIQYYQIQIRPHFFLNCMKNLYAMTATRKYTQMQEMILTMSSYLRAVFQDNPATIMLGKEMESVDSYVKLQQMSSAIESKFTQDIEAELSDFQIPPMSILTFVENSFRYLRNDQQEFQLYIKARSLLDGADKYVNITIMDSGSGFGEETLEILNNTKKRLASEHVGIYNVKQRFELIYGVGCSFLFSNVDGACVDIFIPQKAHVRYDRECGSLYDKEK